ncbi:MFP1 attachment factor 1 [Canna indica]|uniref:MFP1 attachment factor 1 n=1 Tax=Canna indica TaxID=4628 RepID=A0AAQ3QN82_9LILI|nr:MFP1 attachment factor 1 [Canna indica]
MLSDVRIKPLRAAYSFWPSPYIAPFFLSFRSDQINRSPSPSMAEGAASEMKDEAEKSAVTEGGGYPSLSFKIWPPTQRTREAVVRRLVETLTSQSVLSKRYGVIPEEDATSAARIIEEEAFSVASVASAASTGGRPEDEWIEVLHIYSQEISQRVVESAKARTEAASSSVSESYPAVVSSSVSENYPPAASPSTAEI